MLTVWQHLEQNKSFTNGILVKNRVKMPLECWCNSSLCARAGSAGAFTLFETEISPAQLLLFALGVCRQQLSAGYLLPSKGTQSQHLPLPPWRNPPSSSWATHIMLCEFLLRHVIKDFQQWGFNNSGGSLGWCLPFRWFLLTPFLATRQNSSPWPAHHRHKEELFLKPLSQPFLSQSVGL